MLDCCQKLRPAPGSAVTDLLTAKARDEVTLRWAVFNYKHHFAGDMELLYKLELFMGPIQEFLRSTYPTLVQASREVMWLTVVNGILESRTHDRYEMHAAFARLGRMYATRRRVPLRY